MTPSSVRKILLPLLIVAIVVAIAVGWWTRDPSPATISVRHPDKALSIAVAGDVLSRPSLLKQGDRNALARVRDIITTSSVGLANLETTLFVSSDQTKIAAQARLPYGTHEDARQLRSMGFQTLSLANNHCWDFGADGRRATTTALETAGVLHAGSGEDLEGARAAAFIGESPRRVAVVSVAASAAAASRATRSRTDIKGRPGINPLRYSAVVTVDPRTYDLLKGSALDSSRGAAVAEEFTVEGRTIRKGETTGVEVRADREDVADILATIAAARKQADVVVLAVHSHEPSNHSQEPAEFVRGFARQAIDAGASIVVGHGPHQLRGIEVYKHGAILYSVGNLFFDPQALDAKTMDLYDKGVNLDGLALGTVTNAEADRAVSFEADQWWESVIGIATFDDEQRLISLELHSLDLGAGLPLAERGTPRLSNGDRARAIGGRVERLSRPFGTTINVDPATGIIRVVLPSATR